MSPPRKLDAQPGNTNALRHGFYSRSLRQAETNVPDPVNGGDFGSEIAMLRAATRRSPGSRAGLYHIRLHPFLDQISSAGALCQN